MIFFAFVWFCVPSVRNDIAHLLFDSSFASGYFGQAERKWGSTKACCGLKCVHLISFEFGKVFKWLSLII